MSQALPERRSLEPNDKPFDSGEEFASRSVGDSARAACYRGVPGRNYPSVRRTPEMALRLTQTATIPRRLTPSPAVTMREKHFSAKCASHYPLERSDVTQASTWGGA